MLQQRRQQTETRTLAAASAAVTTESESGSGSRTRPLKVLIAGAGISGLTLALSLLKKGIDVQVFERDLTAIRGEGKYRGPIQVQSNALAALEAIDTGVAERVYQEGCITGDRVNGLCDGVTGEWYVKFDTFHPAAEEGMPVTRVISRFVLQQVLLETVERLSGPDVVLGNSHVVAMKEFQDHATGEPRVSVQLEDGREYTGDLLVGTDGIWSKIRKQLIGDTPANYSGYTCYTGISDFCPADIDVVGYRVFLGNGKYFVSSDVGDGKVQWYGFHKEASGGEDKPRERKKRLLEIFGHWNDNVVDLIKATPEDDVLRRDIFDRPPIFKWYKGRVALLGDSAHAMQPNLGQGGCMAIEDAYQFADLISQEMTQADWDPSKLNVERLMANYQGERMMRVSTIHGMAGMAAFMAATYKAYLGEGLGPLSWIQKYKIHHPGRVIGRLLMNLTMPGVLRWVLGGNMNRVNKSRARQCKLTDKPKGFNESDFPLLMNSDAAIISRLQADWLLINELSPSEGGCDSSTIAKGVYIGEEPVLVGSSKSAGCALTVNHPRVSATHARVWKDDKGYYLQDLNSTHGTFVNEVKVPSGAKVGLNPGDRVEFGEVGSSQPFKVKLQHHSLRNPELSGFEYTEMMVGRRPAALVPSMAV